MIALEQLTKRYGDHTAVDGLTLEVPDGELAVLIGPSGCGKTTTLRMVNRLIEPSSGRVLIDGVDTSTLKPEELRRSIGYVIQSAGLFPHLTVAENIATVPRLLGWKAERISKRTSELLDLVGLPPAKYAEKYPRQLSGGEGQRVGVARALAADPPLLLMDEPFGAVDPLTRDRLQGEFARIQRELKKTVIFVTHDVDEAIRLADRIALMRDGKLQQYDTPETLLDHPANKFVHDFMGSDAALKRLARVRVETVMRTNVPVAVDGKAGIVDAALCTAEGFVYLTDGAGVLTGWVDCRVLERGTPPDQAETPVDWREVAVNPGSSLKEALSRMLGAGFRTVPVVDEAGRLLGDVSLSDAERTMESGDAHAISDGPGRLDAAEAGPERRDAHVAGVTPAKGDTPRTEDA